MGWDLVAYADVDQTEVDEYINTIGLDKTNWDDEDQIGAHFSRKKDIEVMYNWNEESQLHELFCIYRVTHIRDDERFSNPFRQMELAKTWGFPFPDTLKWVLWNISKRSEALHVAYELRLLFPDDPDLTYFANWLTKTAEFCDRYELSY